MSLELRLTILHDAGQIGQETYRQIQDAIIWLAEKRMMALTEDNGAMFVTHMAVALERMRKGEAVAPLDESLLAEVAKSEHFTDAQAIAAELEKLWAVNFSNSELGYIWLHLCTLVCQHGE